MAPARHGDVSLGLDGVGWDLDIEGVVKEVGKVELKDVSKGLVLIFFMAAAIDVKFVTNGGCCVESTSFELMRLEFEANPLVVLKVEGPHVFKVNFSFSSDDDHIVTNN